MIVETTARLASEAIVSHRVVCVVENNWLLNDKTITSTLIFLLRNFEESACRFHQALVGSLGVLLDRLNLIS